MFNNLNKTEMKLLEYLSTSPNKDFYCREMAKKARVSVGAASQGLRKLSELGLAILNKRGKETFYKLNSANPAAKHFKMFSELMVLSPLVEKLKPFAERIILFGSTAKGTSTTESDIDLFILTNKKTEVNKQMSLLNISRRLSPIIVSPVEFISLKKNNPALYNSIIEGITLWDERDGQI